MRVAVIGGGAAGFMAAISVRNHHPQATVLLLEKSDKLLAKVRISGGGRCNVTHACTNDRELAANYPRGGRFLRKAFAQWSVRDTIAWFSGEGVSLKTEDDGRMFPTTDSSGTIIDALQGAAGRAKVQLRTQCAVQGMERTGEGWLLRTSAGTERVDRVIVATGGSPKREGLRWLEALGHRIEDPVPSLFTFNLPEDPVRALMGVVADPVRVRLAGTDLEALGPLLVTHWGFSGPAVLRLSAWGARELHRMGYRATAVVNWAGGAGEEPVRALLRSMRDTQPDRKLKNAVPYRLPARLWAFLLEKVGVDPEAPAHRLDRHALNRVVNVLTNDAYQVRGKTTFKDEFVTAGGVSLNDVDPATLRSRVAPGLHFAGEVLDIDGITGGFNFQAAWTTGWIAGKLA